MVRTSKCIPSDFWRFLSARLKFTNEVRMFIHQSTLKSLPMNDLLFFVIIIEIQRYFTDLFLAEDIQISLCG